MVTGDGYNEGGVVLVGFVEVGTIHVDIAGEVDDVAEMIVERGLHIGRKLIRVLGHERGYEVLLVPPEIAGIPHGLEDHRSGALNELEVGGIEKFREIVAKRRRPIWRG